MRPALEARVLARTPFRKHFLALPVPVVPGLGPQVLLPCPEVSRAGFFGTKKTQRGHCVSGWGGGIGVFPVARRFPSFFVFVLFLQPCTVARARLGMRGSDTMPGREVQTDQPHNRSCKESVTESRASSPPPTRTHGPTQSQNPAPPARGDWRS